MADVRSLEYPTLKVLIINILACIQEHFLVYVIQNQILDYINFSVIVLWTPVL